MGWAWGTVAAVPVLLNTLAAGETWVVVVVELLLGEQRFSPLFREGGGVFEVFAFSFLVRVQEFLVRVHLP